MKQKSIRDKLLRPVYHFFYYYLYKGKPFYSIVRAFYSVRQKITKKKLFCDLPWRAMAVNCDGTVTCSCNDPYKVRVLGDIGKNSLLDIWNNDAYRAVREQFIQNHPLFCFGCCYLREGRADEKMLSPFVLHGPKTIWIEPCISCNLSCLHASCAASTPLKKTRSTLFLPFVDFKRVIDELQYSLEEIILYNYGEPFLHKDIFKMAAYARGVIPKVKIYASTNGLLLDTDEKRIQLIEAGFDDILFSIDGASQQSYSYYRRGGDFNLVYNNMKRIIELSNKREGKKPKISWVYILFRWNDSDEEIENALRLAKEAKVDRFFWKITTRPAGAPSRRYKKGSKELKRIEALVSGIFY